MYRKSLDFNSLPAIIQDMIEENSSAAAIIDELIETKGETNTLASLIILDDMNIRGVQITNLYKLCNKKIDKFYEKVLTLTKEDIDSINYESYSICKHKAIYNGNKEDRKNNPEKYIFTDEERNEIRNLKSKDRALNMIEKKQKDLYPSIKTNDGLSIINKQGFNCGYKKTNDTEEGKTITYRVFYNEIGDIIYTYSLEKPDIFLWGECKLNAVRKNLNKEYELIECNSYKNIKEVVGYNIDLRKKPFETYKKILENNDNYIDNPKYEYYNNNLIPIIASSESIKYRQKHNDYKGIVIANIYDLLTFPETYYDLDENLKQKYKTLLSYSEEKAYDEIIYQLNTDEGIEIALELQNVLGINLDKNKLLAAKERFIKANKKHFKIPKSKFLSDLVIEDPLGKEITKRIMKISYKDKVTINE